MSAQTSPRPSFDYGDEARKSLASFEDVDNYFDSFEHSDLASASEIDVVDHLDEQHDVHVDDKILNKETKASWKKKKHHMKGIKWPKKLHIMHHKHHVDRKQVFLEAQEVGESEQGKANANRHIVVLYNPVSGAGVAKKLVDHMVEPVLRLAGCKYTIVGTEYRGFAIEYMLKLDPKTVDGVLIAGGDGLVHEVVTGYFRRPDAHELTLPLGLVPSGTANAMAHELHAHPSKSHAALVGRAALAAARGHTRNVDVIKTQFGDKPDESIYALSVFGWGLAGTVAKAADDMRWIPGQKSFRYDLAGFVSMIKDWPPVCDAVIEYPKDDGSMEKEDISVTNFTATNLPWLGVDHPMTQDVTPDDGYLVVSWVPSTLSRTRIVRMGLQMKSGAFLMEHKAVRTIKSREFKLTVAPTQKHDIDMLIDGDPYSPRDVHVKILHQGLHVFAEPKDINGPLMVKRSHKKKVINHVPLTPTSPPLPIGVDDDNDGGDAEASTAKPVVSGGTKIGSRTIRRITML